MVKKINNKLCKQPNIDLGKFEYTILGDDYKISLPIIDDYEASEEIIEGTIRKDDTITLKY